MFVIKRGGRSVLFAAVAGLFAFANGSATATAGDAAAGERLFRQCAACHTVEPGPPRAGPHLAGIVGREAGSVEGYRYSQAMQDSDFVWTEESIAAYVAEPRDFLPGTSKRVALRNAADAPDLIAYLKTLSAE